MAQKHLDGDEDRYALLSTDGDSHTIMTPAEGTTKLTLVHSPLLTGAPEVNDGAISISLANQTGAKVPFVACATLDYNNEETLPTEADLQALSSIPHYETDLGTVWEINGRTLFIPYTKDLEGYKESRLWISGEETPSYFFFSSKGTSGKVPASKVADPRFYVRTVMHLD